MIKRSAIAAVLAVLIAPAILFGWGEHGHRIIGEVAATKLPPAMPAFFRNAKMQLAYLNPEPDRWRDRRESQVDRAMDDASAPEHFIDMEQVPADALNAALAAPNRYAYLDTLRRAGQTGTGPGLLPWSILELSQRLRVEFRLWRAAKDSTERSYVEARIINDAGILGHYVADGSNPHHTTIYFNGWTGANPNGYATDHTIHGRFESEYVGARITLDDVMPMVDADAIVLPNLRQAIVAYLKASNAEVEHLYQLDKAHPFNRETTDAADKEFTKARLAAGAKMLRDIWWTAYATSG